MKFWDNVGYTNRVFQWPCPIVYGMFRSEVICQVSKSSINFRLQFFGRDETDFYSRLLTRFAVHRLAKFGWAPLADLCLWSLAMKLNAVCSLRRLGKTTGPILSRLFMSFWDYVGDPLYFATHLPGYVYHVSFRFIEVAVKLRAKLS